MKTLCLIFVSAFYALPSFSQEFLGLNLNSFKNKAGNQWEFIEYSDGTIDAVAKFTFGKATYHIADSKVYGYTEEYNDRENYQAKLASFKTYPKLDENAWLFVHPKTRAKIFISLKDPDSNKMQLFYGLAHDDENIEDITE